MLVLSRIMVSVTIGLLLSAAIPQSTRADPAGATRPVIHIEDVARFYKLYDATDGHPTATELQDYIAQGSEGLRYFAKARIVEINDPKLFLAKSGWYPGIELK